MTLPPDGHVHTEWSWDAPGGSMERTCARAVELGLPAVAFTEHADFTVCVVDSEDLAGFPHLQPYAVDGRLFPPDVDVDGYLECLQRCRELYPELRIISGVELGEPHWHADAAARLLAAGGYERVLGSLHCLPLGEEYADAAEHFRHAPAGDVLRRYLAEIPNLVAQSDTFGVLAHIDYAVRYWPRDAGPFDIFAFEDEFRYALRAVAAGDRVLEVNTKSPMIPEIVGWWRQEGGEAVAFGSDAHVADALAHRFAEAAAMVEAHGFRPGRHAYDFWLR
ncbi:MAG: PHP domain-containing protein [Hamadaea sp.]|nr:PHP domain-containing protein [Hamadaea sp.]